MPEDFVGNGLRAVPNPTGSACLVERNHVMVSKRMPPLCKGNARRRVSAANRRQAALGPEMRCPSVRTGAEGLCGRKLNIMKSNANSYNDIVLFRIGLYHCSVLTAQSPLPPFTQGGHALRNHHMVPFNQPPNYNLPFSFGTDKCAANPDSV